MLFKCFPRAALLIINTFGLWVQMFRALARSGADSSIRPKPSDRAFFLRAVSLNPAAAPHASCGHPASGAAIAVSTESQSIHFFPIVDFGLIDISIRIPIRRCASNDQHHHIPLPFHSPFPWKNTEKTSSQKHAIWANPPPPFTPLPTKARPARYYRRKRENAEQNNPRKLIGGEKIEQRAGKKTSA